jgi:hypothetical protein
VTPDRRLEIRDPPGLDLPLPLRVPAGIVINLSGFTHSTASFWRLVSPSKTRSAPLFP